MVNNIITVFNIYFDDKLLYRKTLTSPRAMSTYVEVRNIKTMKNSTKKIISRLTPKTIMFVFHLFVIVVYYNL